MATKKVSRKAVSRENRNVGRVIRGLMRIRKQGRVFLPPAQLISTVRNLAKATA